MRLLQNLAALSWAGRPCHEGCGTGILPVFHGRDAHATRGVARASCPCSMGGTPMPRGVWHGHLARVCLMGGTPMPRGVLQEPHKSGEKILRRQAVFRTTPLFKRENGGRAVYKSGAATRTSSLHFVAYTSSLHFVVLHFVPTLRRWRNRLGVATKCIRLRVATKSFRAWRGGKAVPRPAHSAALVTALQISKADTFFIGLIGR